MNHMGQPGEAGVGGDRQHVRGEAGEPEVVGLPNVLVI